MANRTLTNVANISGVYDGLPFEDSKSSDVQVILADPSFTKTADQGVWIGGKLTYTLNLDNTDGVGPLADVVITDTLDTTMFAYENNSEIVRLDGGAPLVRGTDYSVTYTPATGLLQINFLAGGAIESIPAGSQVTVTFRGDKVAA